MADWSDPVGEDRSSTVDKSWDSTSRIEDWAWMSDREVPVRERKSLIMVVSKGQR